MAYTMKFLYAVFLWSCTCLATEEIPEQYASLLSSKLWQEIQKRLDDSGVGSLQDLESLDSQCPYSTNNSIIIRTHDSINAGAKFLSSVNVSSKEACVLKCCGQTKCSLAVYKDKDQNACYLFDCGRPSVCMFTSHPGFVSMTIQSPPTSHHQSTSTDQHQQHENELTDVAKEHKQNNIKTQPPAPVTVPTTTAATPSSVTKKTTLLPTKNNPPGKLFDKCSSSSGCAGDRTTCLAGFCVCKDGFHDQEGVCRTDCSHIEFECKNHGKPLQFPQCIASYDQCDGIPQCKDQSDELNCDSEDKNIGKVHPTEKTGVNPGHEASMLKPLSHGSSSHTDDKTAEKPDLKQSSNLESSDEDDKVNINRQKSQGKLDSKEKGDSHEDGESHENSHESSVVPDHADLNKKFKVDDHHVISKTQPKPSASDHNKKPSSGLLVVETNKEDLQILKVQQDGSDSNSMTSNGGAIVALALGLCITAIMLVWVGCRLRNVKKRLRRGRVLNSNEADYLINGMYL